MLIKFIKSKIIQNIAALGGVQVVNYLFPLILIPILLKSLGADGWGRIVYIQLFLQYFVVIVTYGFQWSAVNKLSPIRDNILAVNRYFSSYFLAQCLLLMGSIAILILSTLFFEKIKADFYLVQIGFLAVVGAVFFPAWMMQAIEEIKIMALIQFFVQLLCFGAIFFLVNNVDDIEIALFFQSVNNIVVGVFCFYYLYKKGYRIVRITFLDLQEAFRDGFTLFTSQIWIALYTNTIPFILGGVLGPNAVATYTLADKIQKGVRFILNPIGRVLFPRIAYLQSIGSQDARLLFKISMIFTSSVTLVGGLLLFVFSSEVVVLLSGNSLLDARKVIEIFSLMPLLVGLSSTMAIQGLIPSGKSRMLNKIWFSAAIFTLFISFYICNNYGVIGAAYLAVFVELIIVFAMYLVLRAVKR